MAKQGVASSGRTSRRFPTWGAGYPLTPKARRDYDAVELRADRRFDLPGFETTQSSVGLPIRSPNVDQLGTGNGYRSVVAIAMRARHENLIGDVTGERKRLHPGDVEAGYGGSHAGTFVAGEIIQHDRVAWP